MGYEQLLYTAFGWLLGLLAPAIQERIRRTYRASELIVAIRAELHELQFKMALCSHKLETHLVNVTDEHLAWLEQIVSNYSGPNPKAGLLSALVEYRKLSEKQRGQGLALMHNSDVAVGLLQYSLPFINAHMADISLFPVPFQSAVIRIKDQLDTFDQRVVILQKFIEKTFDTSLSAENRALILSDLQKGYRDLADQSKRIADAVSTLPSAK